MMEDQATNYLSPRFRELSQSQSSQDFSMLESSSPTVTEDTLESHTRSSKEAVYQKIIENQRLGFSIAGELGNLRQDLLHSKQDRRILLVQQQNLTEQLHKAEERINQLEDLLNHKIYAIQKMEKINMEDSQQYTLLQDQYTQLQIAYEKLERAQKESNYTRSDFIKLKSEYQTLKDYNSSLEIAAQEIHNINKVQQKDIEELRKQYKDLQAQGNRRQDREIYLGEALADMVLKFEQRGVREVELRKGEVNCHEILEKSVLDVRQKFRLLRQERKSYKKKIIKLMEIVKYYEDMIPLEDHLDRYEDY